MLEPPLLAAMTPELSRELMEETKQRHTLAAERQSLAERDRKRKRATSRECSPYWEEISKGVFIIMLLCT